MDRPSFILPGADRLRQTRRLAREGRRRRHTYAEARPQPATQYASGRIKYGILRRRQTRRPASTGRRRRHTYVEDRAQPATQYAVA